MYYSLQLDVFHKITWFMLQQNAQHIRKFYRNGSLPKIILFESTFTKCLWFGPFRVESITS